VHVLLERELKEINELGEVERGNGAIWHVLALGW
jgi:hypothetical protein